MFPGHQFEFTRDCVEQMIRAGNAKAEMVKWAAEFGVPVTALQAEGNHAKTGDGWGGQAHRKDNWDYASGRWAEQITGEWSDWQFTPDTTSHDNWYVNLDICDMTIISTHGNHIRAHGRTPFYGLQAYARACYEQLPKQQRLKPRILLMHHFHQPAMFQFGETTVVMNGALQEFTSHAAKGSYCPNARTQNLILVKLGDAPRVWGYHPIVCE